MKLPLILFCLFITGEIQAQIAPKKIKVKVDYLLNLGDSTEVWVKRAHPYRATKMTYFAATLPNPLPDSLKLGATITLYLGKPAPGSPPDPCSIPFKLMPKTRK